MKKILIIHHGEGVGGGLIALLGLIEELKQTYHVEVLCVFNSTAIPYIEQKGVKVVLTKSFFYLRIYRLFLHSEASCFNLLDFARSILNFICYFLSKYFFAKEELKQLSDDYELIYLNSTFISDWALAGNVLNKKVIIHVREPLAKGVLGFRRAVIRNTIKTYCDWIIAISKDNADRINVREKTTVVYDPVVINNRSEQSLIVLQKEMRYFLYLGGMQRIKGFEQLVKSLPYLKDNIRIFFLGGGLHLPESKIKRYTRLLLDPFLWRIGKLIKQLNQSKHIINVGLVDHVFDYYAKSLAVISPFAKPHAALPILEAFSMGKPVIVSDIKGMDEIVNENNGVFFENHNYKSLAFAINSLADLPKEQYEGLSKHAKASYLSLYQNGTVQSVVENVLNYNKEKE